MPALVETGVNAVLELVTTMVENGLQLLDVGNEFIGNLVQGIIDSIPAVLESSETVLSEFLTNIMDNLPNVLETGVNVVTELVQGIVNTFPDVITSAINLVGTLLNTVLENAPALIEGGLSLVGELIGGILQAAPDLIGQIPGIISDMKDAFFDIDWMQIGKDIIKAVINGVVDFTGNLSKKVGEAVNKAKKKFKDVDWKQVGKDIINGIIKGVVSIAGQLYEELRSLAQSALRAAKKALGINSPSRVFRDVVGKMIPAGITVGLEDEFPSTIDALKNQSGLLIDVASGMIPNILDHAMPVMATGTILPANAGFTVQSQQLDAIASKLAELAARTGSMEHVINNQSTYQFTAQINRRTLFEEFMEEAKIRQAQTGKNVFDL